ncbi:uncharacterized protein LOC135704010 [Ochlerotatus camptorhynchus]|uniref:uncharacterized protein LOC135704010 n=1 Tax=Ochlerotatus camptorhynchus TaxID=644619 RepID=UPI0031CFEF08
MNRLTEFEKPLYSKPPEHPGIWQPHLYRSRPIKSSMESSDPHLLDGYAFSNLYLESPSEVPVFSQADAERYEDFALRIKYMNGGRYGCIYREHFDGKALGVDCLKKDIIDRSNTTYRRDLCQSNRELDSVEVKRKKIRTSKRNVPLPRGWYFKPTSTGAAHRTWEELSSLIQAAANQATNSTNDHQKI